MNNSVRKTCFLKSKCMSEIEKKISKESIKKISLLLKI